MTKMTKYLLLLFLTLSCSADDVSSKDKNNTIKLEYNSLLIFEHQGELDTKKNAIASVARETLQLVNAKMSVDNIKIKVKNNPGNTIPEIGIGGFNPNQYEVLISVDLGFNNLDQSISTVLGPTLAHEIHHLKRRRSVGYGDTLLEACITEGLADHFSMEVFGIDPPMWSTALSESELEHWIDEAKMVWNNSAYNHFNWFYGATPEIPRWTGYAIGYKLVNDYLSQNPEAKPSTLHDETANSFINEQ